MRLAFLVVLSACTVSSSSVPADSGPDTQVEARDSAVDVSQETTVVVDASSSDSEVVLDSSSLDGEAAADSAIVPEDFWQSYQAPADPCDYPFGRNVPVATARELTAALASARPGDRIQLSDGIYDDRFELSAMGTEREPIVVCGSRNAILDGGSVSSGYALTVRDASWVVLSGFSVRGAKKGLILERSSHNLISAVEISRSGQEALHLRAGSSSNLLRQLAVHHTGELGGSDREFSECIYIGSAESNWCTYSDPCVPDASNNNIVARSHLGPGCVAEAIDIKEGSSGGLIIENQIDAAGLYSGGKPPDSCIDVKGNDYRLEGNVCFASGAADLLDGIQVHVIEGYGQRVVLERNEIRNAPRYGIYVQSGSDTHIGCSNTASGAMELANIACVP